jgi:hypothetical protein
VSLALIFHLLGMHSAADMTRWLGLFAGAAVAGYTAFLLNQCEGRDLWQSTLLLPHLIVQAILCGAVALIPFQAQHGSLLIIATIAAVLHAALALIERYRSHETENAKQGAAFLDVIKLGPLKPWRDGLIIGAAITVLILLTFPEAAFIPALVGLLLYEYAFIRAGQLPPLS